MDLSRARLTTAEAAQRLGCDHECALPLLKAAGIMRTRMGRRGPWLWDTEGVERLCASLRVEPRPELLTQSS